MLVQTILTGAVAGLASTAHCAAMCGPLSAAACGVGSRNARALVRYQAGRMLGYAALGAIAGGFGQALTLHASAPWTARALPVLSALALLFIAARVWRSARGETIVSLRRKPTRSKRLSAVLFQLAPREPSVLGALSALLPCGALLAAVLLAAAEGTRGAGALLMLGFAVTSALGALGGGALLAQLPALRGARASRLVALALASIALVIGAQPFVSAAREPSSNGVPSVPECHS